MAGEVDAIGTSGALKLYEKQVGVSEKRQMGRSSSTATLPHSCKEVPATEAAAREKRDRTE